MSNFSVTDPNCFTNSSRLASRMDLRQRRQVKVTFKPISECLPDSRKLASLSDDEYLLPYGTLRNIVRPTMICHC